MKELKFLSIHLNDGVINPPTLSDGLSSIKVGTDCSGLDAPIIALQAAGIDHRAFGQEKEGNDGQGPAPLDEQWQ